jgi:serine/threonine protein kinase
MAWPTASEYFEAVQNPALCFLDDELRQGEAACSAQGLPILYSGNFASVFRIDLPARQRSCAIKCFTRKSARREERYRHISAHLQRAALPFMVPFVYLEKGIRIGGEWYPILKMEWVAGQTLNQFVAERLDKPALLKLLAEMWVKLAQRLTEVEITHADLQHGNIMLIPGSAEGRVALKLVDYDGMYLPALKGVPSGELGHPTYQSPQRLVEGYYGPEVDRFSHLVIFTALRALTIKGRELWKSYDNGDNLLFTQADFKTPQRSKLLYELWQSGPDELRHLAGRLTLAAAQPVAKVAPLDEVVQQNTVRPLTREQVQEVDAMLNAGAETVVLTRADRVTKAEKPAPRAPAREWPGAEDFRSAILAPASSFADADLREAVAVPGADGLPRSFAGQHSIVFSMRAADNRQWAAKCFTDMDAGRQDHYRTLGAYLQARPQPFLVGFVYLEQGIQINGDWYPILKMDWVEGHPLAQFVERFFDPAALRVVRDLWAQLAQDLRDTELTHGDLQPSNILVVPGDAAWRLSLKLVDYDGMRAPGMPMLAAAEFGHPAYQHPQRSASAFQGPEVDRFAILVIYAALRAAMTKGKVFFQAYSRGDNLLFNEADFRTPWESRALRELWQAGPEDLRFLAGYLVLAVQQRLEDVPVLAELFSVTSIKPLTGEQVEQMQRILGDAKAAAPVGADGVPIALPVWPPSPSLMWPQAGPLDKMLQAMKGKNALWFLVGGIGALVVFLALATFFVARLAWGSP